MGKPEVITNWLFSKQRTHELTIVFLWFLFLVRGGHGLAWSARHAWWKRGKNITHNSNNYFFNLFVITHVWCCLPMSALHLPSLAWRMQKKGLFSRLFLAKPGKRACLTLRAWERTNNNLNSPWCCLWNPNLGFWVGGNNCKYYSHHCTTPTLKCKLVFRKKYEKTVV